MRAALRLLVAGLAAAGVPALAADPRLRDVMYDATAVVSVPVKRGVVTLVVFDPDEAILEVAAGRGGDCAKSESAWCIVAQPGGRTLFIKARTAALADNNVAVVTDRRSHSLRFEVLPARDPRPPVYRLRIRSAMRAPALPRAAVAAVAAAASAPSRPEPIVLQPLPRWQDIVAGRLGAMPQVVNTSYSVAEGRDSEEILPSLVFDDGRFTYLRFPGNREVPAVFHVRSDGSETLVNARMEDELLVVDRVSRRLVLRAGDSVVGLWNEAFDLEGAAPGHGTTVPGVQRVLKAQGAPGAGGATR